MSNDGLKDAKDFPYPLDKDIVEQTPVKKVVVDFDEKGRPTAQIKTVMQQQTVRYMNVPKLKIRCSPGQHFWTGFRPSQWKFACNKCRYVITVYPSTHRVNLEAGTIQNKKTLRFI